MSEWERQMFADLRRKDEEGKARREAARVAAKEKDAAYSRAKTRGLTDEGRAARAAYQRAYNARKRKTLTDEDKARLIAERKAAKREYQRVWHANKMKDEAFREARNAKRRKRQVDLNEQC